MRSAYQYSSTLAFLLLQDQKKFVSHILPEAHLASQEAMLVL